MAFTGTLESKVTAGKTVTRSKAYTADAQDSREISIADSVSDQEVVIAIDITQLQFLYIVADQDLTLEFNNATTGVPTIELKANVPFIERATADQYHTSLLTVDITNLFVSNSSGAVATLNIEHVFDATL